MNEFADIAELMLAVEELPPSPLLNAGLILGGAVLLVAIILFAFRATAPTQYDIDANYGGGGGLRDVFRHKKLKRVDKHGKFRGKSRTFRDLELEQLLHDNKLSEAAKYLTGLLNAAKDAGDRYTLVRYSEYSTELIKMYDDMEAEQRGGKAVHLKK